MEILCYSEQLKDMRWAEFRQDILWRDNHTCKCCGKSYKKMDVHHLKYGVYLWDSDFDAVTLCRRCHKKLHNSLDFNFRVWTDGNSLELYDETNDDNWVILNTDLIHNYTPDKPCYLSISGRYKPHYIKCTYNLAGYIQSELICKSNMDADALWFPYIQDWNKSPNKKKVEDILKHFSMVQSCYCALYQIVDNHIIFITK